MEYFYHYTTLKNWKKIQKEGLQPYRAIDDLNTKELPALAHKPAIFGLASAAPESWLSYPCMQETSRPISILEAVLRHIYDRETNGTHQPETLVLLKIRLLSGDDVRIGDYDQIMQRVAGSFDDPSTYQRVMTNYCKSVKKLRDKFNVAAAKKLPEVLCFNAIPAHRIEIVDKIPSATLDKISAYIDKKIKSNKAAAKPANHSLPAASATRPKRSAP